MAGLTVRLMALCGSPARPDLWEAGESDLPGPPDIPATQGGLPGHAFR
jgi:hypothetical protein